MSIDAPLRPGRGRLEIALLGPPTFRIGDDPFVFKAPPLCLPLLAYLLVNRRSTIQRTSLAFLFWPDDDEEDARGKLRRHLYRLTAALPASGEPWINGDPRQLQWNAAAPATFDVELFEERSARGADPEAAIGLYRGDFLDGRYEDWIFPHRERLRAVQVDNFTTAIARRRSGGDFERAIALAKGLLALDPWREHTVRLLMNLRYEQGDRAGAMAEYETFVRRLQTEMDTAPMPETVAAYENVVRGAVVAVADGPTADSRGHRDSILPFAGRERELELAQDAYAHCAAGRGRSAIVTGEAGIGKSRFVREATARFEAQGASVFVGVTSRTESVPYQPIVEALRAALPILGSLGKDGAWRGALSTLLPELDDGTADAESAIEPGRRRTRLFEAVSLAFERLAGARPCVIVLEDLHWAGSATLEMLEYLVRRLVARRALLIATYRSEEASRSHPLRSFRRALERDGLLAPIPLPRLGANDVHAIVRAYAADGEDADALAGDLYRQSEGNGFFLSQALRNRLNDGPTTGDLSAAMRGNFERLDAPAQTFAQTAAVVGDAFDVELVIEITKWPEHEALAALDVLLDAGFLREASALRRRDYAFAHHLLQSFVYDTVPEPRRRREHLRAAIALPELYPAARDELHADVANHFERSGSPERAAPHFARAAERALDVFANEEAAGFAARAAEHATDAAVRFDARSISEEAHRRLARRAEQAADLEAMGRDASALGPDATFDVLRRKIKLYHVTGDREREAAGVAELQALIGPNDGPWRAEADYAEAALRMRNGELVAAIGAAARAVSAFRAAGVMRRAVEALGLAAEIAALNGDFGSAEAHVAEGRELAAALGDAGALAPLLNSAASAAFYRRDFAAAMRYGDELLEVSRRIGDREGEADANARLAMLFVRAQSYARAEQHYDAAEKLYAAMNKRLGRAIVLLNKGCLVCSTGDPDEALAGWEAAIPTFEELNDLRGQALCWTNTAWAHLAMRRLDAARDAIVRADAIAAELASPIVRAQTLVNLGYIEYELGDTQAGLRDLQSGIALRPPDSPELAEDYGILGLALLAEGRLDEALDMLTELEARADAVTTSMWDPQDLWWACARIRRAAGDLDGYRVALDRAATALDERLSAIPDPVRRDRLRKQRHNPEIAAAAG